MKKDFKMNRLIPLLLLVACIFAFNAQVRQAFAKKHKPSPAQAFQAFFDAAIPGQLAAEHVAGATVAVVQNGELTFAKGYGLANLETNTPVQADQTLFFIGSAGKLFTWTAVMQLVEQGKLDLNTDVNTYLDFELRNTFAQPITLHHLLTHTAGFEDEARSLFVTNESELLTLRKHLIRYQPARVYPPGDVMAYSNYGTALAGYIVERVSGQSFESYLTDHILRPLGMAHSFVGNHLPPELATNISQGYHYNNGGFAPSAFEWTAATPCAPIRASAVDLSRFMIMQLNAGCVVGECLLRPETIAKMHALQFNHPQQTDGMAYGIMRMHINDQVVLWHTGRSPRFVSVLALLPEQNLGLFVSYNTPPADDGRAILFQFLNTFFPVERTPMEKTLLPGWEQRAKMFNGTYVPARSNHTTPEILTRYTQSAQIQMESGQLTFNGWEFYEIEPGLFRQVGGDRLLAFATDDNGRNWFFVGILAYFQVPWHDTPGFLLAVVSSSLLLTLAFFPVWWPRRKFPSTPGAGLAGLASGLGLFNLAVFAWLTLSFLQFANTFVYPQAAVAQIVGLYWLSVPWTVILLAVTLHAWFRRTWTLGWRIYCAMLTVSALMFLWLLVKLNLLA